MKHIKMIVAVVAFVAVITGANVVSAQPASAACIDYQYGYSSTVKTCVKYIQVLSNNVYANNAATLGGQRILTVDGKYGPNTTSAILNLQRHSYVTNMNGTLIPLRTDGLTGKQTWAVLCSGFNNLGIYSPDYYAMQNAGCGFGSNPLNNIYPAVSMDSRTH